MAWHEWRAEAGREGCGRFGHADLRPGDARGVAREEVIHRLIGGELGDRRQHAIGIGGQHDYRFRHRPHIFRRSVGDELDGIRATAVLGEAVVIEIDFTGGGIDHDIFQHGAEALGRGENLGLGLWREADHLGVAATFEVEHGGIRPAMLIVADQRAAGVGAERGLAGARQAEEHGRVALRADIGRAMHWHDPLGREQIVEQAEHRLLHLTSISRAANQDQLFGEIDRDHRLAARAVARRIGAEAGQIDDGIFGGEGRQFRRRRAAQQSADELAVPGKFGDDLDSDAVFRLRSAEQMLDIELVPGSQRGEEIGFERGEMAGLHALVGLAPPDRVFGFRIADDELVIGAAAGVRAGGDDERAILGQHALSIADGMFYQRGGGQIFEQGCGCRNSFSADDQRHNLSPRTLFRDARCATHSYAQRVCRPVSQPERSGQNDIGP